MARKQKNKVVTIQLTEDVAPETVEVEVEPAPLEMRPADDEQDDGSQDDEQDDGSQDDGSQDDEQDDGSQEDVEQYIEELEERVEAYEAQIAELLESLESMDDVAEGARDMPPLDFACAVLTFTDSVRKLLGADAVNKSRIAGLRRMARAARDERPRAPERATRGLGSGAPRKSSLKPTSAMAAEAARALTQVEGNDPRMYRFPTEEDVARSVIKERQRRVVQRGEPSSFAVRQTVSAPAPHADARAEARRHMALVARMT